MTWEWPCSSITEQSRAHSTAWPALAWSQHGWAARAARSSRWRTYPGARTHRSPGLSRGSGGGSRRRGPSRPRHRRSRAGRVGREGLRRPCRERPRRWGRCRSTVAGVSEDGDVATRGGRIRRGRCRSTVAGVGEDGGGATGRDRIRRSWCCSPPGLRRGGRARPRRRSGEEAEHARGGGSS